MKQDISHWSNKEQLIVIRLYIFRPYVSLCLLMANIISSEKDRKTK
jgi:hypothetical protein